MDIKRGTIVEAPGMRSGTSGIGIVNAVNTTHLYLNWIIPPPSGINFFGHPDGDYVITIASCKPITQMKEE